MHDLPALGFGPFFEKQLARMERSAGVPGRIASGHRGAYVVWSASGAGSARLAGKLRVRLEEEELPAVGDWVVLDGPPCPDRTPVIEEVFDDIAALSARCRFRDCRHDTEPGCAVKEAASSGELSAERLEHCRKLEREAKACELRHDERLRRRSERVWGQLSDEVARLRRWKGGKP